NAAKAKAEREQKRKKDKRVRDFSTELFELSLRGQAEKASVSDLKTALQKGDLDQAPEDWARFRTACITRNPQLLNAVIDKLHSIDPDSKGWTGEKAATSK